MPSPLSYEPSFGPRRPVRRIVLIVLALLICTPIILFVAKGVRIEWQAAIERRAVARFEAAINAYQPSPGVLVWSNHPADLGAKSGYQMLGGGIVHKPPAAFADFQSLRSLPLATYTAQGFRNHRPGTFPMAIAFDDVPIRALKLHAHPQSTQFIRLPLEVETATHLRVWTAEPDRAPGGEIVIPIEIDGRRMRLLYSTTGSQDVRLE